MITQKRRQRVAVQARFQCGYCRTQEAVSGIPLTLEHIFPKAQGGTDDEENLWLSCRLCNEAKGVLVETIDPQTGQMALCLTLACKPGQNILPGVMMAPILLVYLPVAGQPLWHSS